MRASIQQPTIVRGEKAGALAEFEQRIASLYADLLQIVVSVGDARERLDKLAEGVRDMNRRDR